MGGGGRRVLSGSTMRSRRQQQLARFSGPKRSRGRGKGRGKRKGGKTDKRRRGRTSGSDGVSVFCRSHCTVALKRRRGGGGEKGKRGRQKAVRKGEDAIDDLVFPPDPDFLSCFSSVSHTHERHERKEKKRRGGGGATGRIKKLKMFLHQLILHSSIASHHPEKGKKKRGGKKPYACVAPVYITHVPPDLVHDVS